MIFLVHVLIVTVPTEQCSDYSNLFPFEDCLHISYIKMATSLVWINFDDKSTPNGKSTHGLPYSRRPHKKSRDGCCSCKRRRLKVCICPDPVNSLLSSEPQCDEVRPHCGQCRLSDVACSYAKARGNRGTGQSNRQTNESFANPRNGSAASCLTGGMTGTDLLASSLHWCLKAQGWPEAASGQTYAELLSRFNSLTVATLSSLKGQQIISTKITRLVPAHPFLMHAVVALTAAHLTYLRGRSDDLTAITLYHTQQALSLYNGRLQEVKERMEMDATIATCLMLTALFFWSDDEYDTPWIFSKTDSGGDPAWSTILSGFMVLIRSAAFHATALESAWLPFLCEFQSVLMKAPKRSGPGSRLVTLLHDIISEGSRNKDDDEYVDGIGRLDPYLVALDALAPVLRARFDPKTSTIGPCTDVADFVTIMRFPSTMGRRFTALLSNWDETALLLVGFWFAAVAKLQHCQWWCLRRALVEGRAIYRYLNAVQPHNCKFSAAVSILERAFFN